MNNSLLNETKEKRARKLKKNIKRRFICGCGKAYGSYPA